MQLNVSKICAAMLTAVLAASMGACGGGGPSGGLAAQANLPATPGNLPGSTGSSGGSATFGPITSAAGPNSTSLVNPACVSCSAVSATAYLGSGTGIWFATNGGAAIQQIPISISGLKGQTVQLVFANTTIDAVDTSSFATLLAPVTPVAKLQVTAKAAVSAGAAMAANVAEFNHTGFASLLKSGAATQGGAVSKAAIAPNSYALNSSRPWIDGSGVVRNTTLVRQATTSDGTIVDLWVEASENVSSRITSAMDDTLISNYTRPGGIYDMVVSIGGPLWGAQRYSNLIPSNQPVNIVVINIDNNNTPFGTFGYFSALNNFVPNTSDAANSNGALAFFLDSETMYLGGTAGMSDIITGMAHESTHMQNFYRRSILQGSMFAYDTWLDEQTAMMMEDWVSYTLNPAYNSVRDGRAANYVQEASYNCSMINFDTTSSTCDSYSVNGSFGGFLNRQLGLAFFKDLLYRVDSVNSVTVLDEAIKAANSSTSFADAFNRFAVTMGALVPATNAPAGFAFPARSDSGFTLVSIDPANYVKLLPAITASATAAPTTLNAFAAFPMTRARGTGVYGEGVPVPPGVTLDVAIF